MSNTHLFYCCPPHTSPIKSSSDAYGSELNEKREIQIKGAELRIILRWMFYVTRLVRIRIGE